MRDKIAPVEVGGKVRYNFSFASKFCSWHRHDAYPIYDSLAELSLWSYGKQFQLDFDTKDRWEYIPFAERAKRFRAKFDLECFSFKDLDKFLYLTGDKMIAEREDARKNRPASAEAGA